MNLSRNAVLVITLLAPLATFAQGVPGLATRVKAATYPSLALQARIQGEVRLRFGPDGVTVVSGQPLLAAAAVNNLKGLGRLPDDEIEVTYHFILGGDIHFQVARRVEKRGNRFERLILHAFALKTERVVEYTECIAGPIPPENRIEVTERRIEAWIYHSVPCLLTSTSQIALR